MLTICIKNHRILRILIKTITQTPPPPIIKSINIFVVINKHKAKIYNHCTYTQIIIKNIFPFFSSESIRMSENRINFDDKKTKKVTSTITKTKRYLI